MKTQIQSLLLATMVIIISPAASGTCSPASHITGQINNNNYENVRMQQSTDFIDSDFITFISQLSQKLPLDANNLSSLGLKIIDYAPTDRTKYFAVRPVTFADGVIASKIELRFLHGNKRRGHLLILDLEGRAVLKNDLEKTIGDFSIYSTPRGRSTQERYIYIHRQGNCAITIETGQDDLNKVQSICFDSIADIE